MAKGTQPRPWFRGSKNRWYVTIDGEQVSLKVPGPEGTTEAAAWAALAELLADRSARLSEPRGSASRAAVTVAGAVAAWVAEVGDEVAPQTSQVYRWYAGRLADALGDRAVDAGLTAKEVRASVRPTWSQNTRRNYLATASRVLAAAGWPHAVGKLPGQRAAGAERLLTDDQHAAVLDEASGDLRQYLRVLWEVGSRPQELAGLDLGGVRWDQSIAVLSEHKNARHGKKRTLYFTPAAVKVLRRQAERYGAGLAFRNKFGRRLSANALVKRMETIARRVGFPVTAYSYRHTFITRALARGVTAAQVAELCGTSVQMISRHYGHLEAVPGLMREVLGKMTDKPTPDERAA